MTEITYTVPDMSCGHCKQAVSGELAGVAGVETIDVDLDTKLVTVRGHDLDDAALRAAIEEAGYQAVT
ncbi:MAG TPA: heavy-metal-associated domain-containing protein [Gaiellaceae bacterium]|nr:heavy-metal-associated domain-containing protein [Gaiellaceae bacterium]